MLNEESMRRQKELESYIYDLSTSCKEENELREFVIKLENLYSNNFRHSYSGFFPIILEMSKDDNDFNLDYLSNNLDEMKNIVEQDYISNGKKNPKNKKQNIYKNLFKLSDHINLEIGRYNYYAQNDGKLKDIETKNKKLQDQLAEATEKYSVARKELADTRKDIEKTKEELKISTTSLNDATKKLENVQSEIIAVLSIFAAIVLTFSGSLSLLGSALKGMEKAPFFKSVFFVLLCGFVVLNIIFILLYIVGKITGRNIYVRCETLDCTCDKGKPKCSPLVRLRKRLPYVFWINVIFIVLMTIDLIVFMLNSIFEFVPI